MQTLDFTDFQKIELRIGTIIRTEAFPEARKPAYKLWVDLGELGIKKSSAQLTVRYQVHELVGKQVLCVCNLAPRQIGPFLSEILVTGFSDENGGIVLASVEAPVPNGARLH
ncbi:putative tRNA-binding chaperone [Nitritalea halalkaliphila LW7]|uniref:Putative tRNA-binding chaperone n=1 Tax=Nitritalea halalkaliphila LW7 TaxID=1189621 RepID=I5C165_9BACT|nr:tRNA-binding protein [Nitritalea halalkaliphila]EIM75567.1 putative tRNA-binding chaperone [Nitritalea halalkaliphila LW7]